MAKPLCLDLEVIRELFAVCTRLFEDRRRGLREAALRRKVGRYFQRRSQAVEALRRWVVRASSRVENLNSRLRGYFFLRRHLGDDYLALHQFLLNHRRFPRSKHPDRVEKSPIEVLSGQRHPN